jgi:asparagine synthase (glutamine-hydrolysing)
MEPWLPRDVVYWPKTGFGVPLRKWSHSELRDVMEDTLSASRLKSRGLYDPSAVTS